MFAVLTSQFVSFLQKKKDDTLRVPQPDATYKQTFEPAFYEAFKTSA